METLIIYSKSKSNARLLSSMARKLGDKVLDTRKTGKADALETHFASESALAKDWLTNEEDEAWKNL